MPGRAFAGSLEKDDDPEGERNRDLRGLASESGDNASFYRDRNGCCGSSRALFVRAGNAPKA